MWAHLTAPKVCNRCRKPLAVGAWAYRGQYAVWCEPCGGEMGFDGQPAVRETQSLTALSEFLERFKQKHGRRDVSARILGERDGDQ